MRKKLIVLGFALTAAVASTTLAPANAAEGQTICPFYPYHLVTCPGGRVICCPNNIMCDCP
jgi:hypothetical protein